MTIVKAVCMFQGAWKAYLVHWWLAEEGIETEGVCRPGFGSVA